MTRDDDPLESEADFADALRALVRRAHDADVDVEGGWECRTESDLPDWDVIVTEVGPAHLPGTARSASDPEAVDD